MLIWLNYIINQDVQVDVKFPRVVKLHSWVKYSTLFKSKYFWTGNSIAMSVNIYNQPSILVRLVHSVPHLNISMNRVNSSFDPKNIVYREVSNLSKINLDESESSFRMQIMDTEMMISMWIWRLSNLLTLQILGIRMPRYCFWSLNQSSKFNSHNLISIDATKFLLSKSWENHHKNLHQICNIRVNSCEITK